MSYKLLFKARLGLGYRLGLPAYTYDMLGIENKYPKKIITRLLFKLEKLTIKQFCKWENVLFFDDILFGMI